MSINNLSENETEYIQLWGELYSNRGQKELLGKMWGLLTLRADTPENGLDQFEISNLLHCSVSTVSRDLKTLTNMQIVSYIDRDTRKYYVSKNFKEISNLRFYASVHEYKEVINELKTIKNDMTPKDLEENQNLVNTIDLTETVLKNISDIFLNVLNERK